MKTANDEEIAKFAKASKTDKRAFEMLESMNELRCKYILSKIHKIEDKSILDIGCGIGILSESLSKVCKKVTGLDPCDSAIEEARSLHLDSSVNYVASSVEAFCPNEKYDIVCAMEVVEHVDNLPFFIKMCSELLKDDGLIFFSTINRTKRSYLFAIVLAEYIARFLPTGTHDWSKFVKPSELESLAQKASVHMKHFSGMKYNPLLGNWRFSSDLGVNYICYGSKPSLGEKNS